MKLTLFLLERGPRASVGYDEYLGFVVRAIDETMARAIVLQREPDAKYLKRMHCTPIGVAPLGAPSGIVLESFNAG